MFINFNFKNYIQIYTFTSIFGSILQRICCFCTKRSLPFISWIGSSINV